MIKIPKPKKLILDNSMLEEDFFEDTKLLGIVSAVESYRLVWSINQATNYRFSRNHLCEIEQHENYFEVYGFNEPEKLIEHAIYTNRKRMNYLLPEAKNIDFIWLVKGSFLSHFYTTELPMALNKVATIDYCFEINPEQLKSKYLLIL